MAIRSARCNFGLVLARTAVVAGLAGLTALGATGCKPSPESGAACSCTPGNASRTQLGDGSFMDGASLLGKLRLHRQQVEQHRTPRDIKVFDDELRFAILGFCAPCSDWIQDRMTIEQMFPLARLDEATSAVCLGLVLRDGTTAWGETRPPACRR
jgi:hypothetical protein